MRLLNEMEEKEKIIIHTQKLRNFHKEINDTYDKKLDDALTKLIYDNNLEDTDIEYWLRQYKELIKK